MHLNVPTKLPASGRAFHAAKGTMFNWFKKTVSTGKATAGPALSTVQQQDEVTPLAIKESEALKNEGNLHFDRGGLGDAEACYRRAISCYPRYAEGYTNLGRVAHAHGNLNEAITLYRKAIEFKPALMPAHLNLSAALIDLGNLDAAEEVVNRVLAQAPESAAAWFNLGAISLMRKQFLQAETAIRRGLELQPDSVDGHANMGVVFMQTKRLAEAETSYRRVLELRADHVQGHANLGLVLAYTGRLPEAEASFRRALELRPNYVQGHINMGVVLTYTERLREAEASYRRALELQPDCVEADYKLAFCLLLSGQYAQAWPYYESRYDSRLPESSVKRPSLPFPKWQGESLVGKSFVVVEEQGYGDFIQFARYVKMLRDRGVARLTLVCTAALVPLLETLEGVDVVVTQITGAVHYDYWSFILSLPLFFHTTLENIPARMPYLHALTDRMDRWRNRLPLENLNIGLVWKGNPDHTNDAHRSLPGLSTLAPLWSVPGLNFISLQKGAAEEEANNPPSGQPLIALGAEIGDFADSAAIVEQLDLVICVDTAIAHLAGALGKPCWVLLPSMAVDWRWMIGREDSPWYESLRLFRNKKIGDWSELIECLRQELVTFASSPKLTSVITPDQEST